MCASFSRAVRPAVRSRTSPCGLSHLSPAMFAKVRAGNSQNKWVRELVDIAIAAGVAYWVANPDGSFFWLMPGWENEKLPSSDCIFRVDMCTLGTRWRKRTRVAADTALAGARLLCKRKGRRKAWTRVAQVYPGGFADTVALAIAAKLKWTRAFPLDPAACAKLGTCCRVGEAKKPGPAPSPSRAFLLGFRSLPPLGFRVGRLSTKASLHCVRQGAWSVLACFALGFRIGEASNPGPRARSAASRAANRNLGLEHAPLQSQASLLAVLGMLFLSGALLSLSFDPSPVFALCPGLTAMVLRAYGNALCAAGEPTHHSYRYTMVAGEEPWHLRGSF